MEANSIFRLHGTNRRYGRNMVELLYVSDVPYIMILDVKITGIIPLYLQAEIWIVDHPILITSIGMLIELGLNIRLNKYETFHLCLGERETTILLSDKEVLDKYQNIQVAWNVKERFEDERK